VDYKHPTQKLAVVVREKFVPKCETWNTCFLFYDKKEWVESILTFIFRLDLFWKAFQDNSGDSAEIVNTSLTISSKFISWPSSNCNLQRIPLLEKCVENLLNGTSVPNHGNSPSYFLYVFLVIFYRIYEMWEYLFPLAIKHSEPESLFWMTAF